MAKNTNQKKQLVENYRKLVNKAAGIYLFSGSLNASKTQALKKVLSDDAKLTLIKNTLFNLAVKEEGIEINAADYNNVLFVGTSLIEDAGALSKFLSENDYKINSVVVGTNVYNGSRLKEIAGLGSAYQVNGKLVSILATPATLLVKDLQSPIQKLVSVLSQIK
ncbi:MAG: 50S ribosomal protein L10 [bacterium]